MCDAFFNGCCQFSPHARGWPDERHICPLQLDVLPARAGMARRSRHRHWSQPGVLPARAGMARPLRRPRQGLPRVLPARAGMARAGAPTCILFFGFSPHARGWPEPGATGTAEEGRSPRTRGDGPASPASLPFSFCRSPRTRGDGPGGSTSCSILLVSSPRTRGDGPRHYSAYVNAVGVLPARAGMARSSRQ